MNCGEFRRWFAILLAGGDAADWPEREYQLHSLRCPACQMLLGTNEITQAVTDVASIGALTVDEMLIGEEVLGRIKRKMAFRRILRRASVAAGVGVVILLVVLFSRGGKTGEVPPREQPQEVAAVPATPKEFAGSLATEDFEVRTAYQVRKTKALFFEFDRTDPTADQYEQVKSVLLSGYGEAFPDASVITVSIVDEDGESVLRVSVDRGKLPQASDVAGNISGAVFCRMFRVLNDKDGRALPQQEDFE